MRGARKECPIPPNPLSIVTGPVTKWASGTFRSLRIYNYRLWAAGALVSNIGTWMQRIAQDWLVMTQLTDKSASAVGIVTALQFAPQLLLLPWTGLAADRFDQRKLVMATQATMGLLAAALGVLTIAGVVTLWQVYVFAFLFGCAAAFDAPARQAFVSEMVGPTDLANAVALNSTSFNSGRMIGPAVAGLAIATVGTGWAFIANGVSFVAVLLSLCFFRLNELFRSERAPRTRGGFGEGLRYVWARSDLRTVMIIMFLVGTFGMNFAIWTSAMAVKVFHTDAHGYGLLSSIMAVGTIAGALLAAGRERPEFKHLQIGAAAFTVSCFGAALSPGYWFYAAALVVIGVSVLTLLNSSNALVQLTTEPRMRGRVISIRLAITLGGTPIGAPIVGWIADHYGPRWSLGVGVAAGALAALVATLYLAKRGKPDKPLEPTVVRGDLVQREGKS